MGHIVLAKQALRYRVAACGIFGLVLGSMFVAIPVEAAPTAGAIGVAPCTFDENNPVTRAYFVLPLSPGTAQHNCVVVNNTGTSAVDLYVNAVDGLTGTTSGSVYANRQDPVKKWGAWVHPDAATVTVPASGRINVGFTVAVPGDASAGDHLAGLAFENQHPAAPASGQIQITTITRSVIGVLTQVPGPASFNLNIYKSDIQALPSAHSAAVIITLADTGLALGKPLLNVTLQGPNGYQKTLSRQLDTVLPGDTIPYPLNWPDALASGDYNITVQGTFPGGKSTSTIHAKQHLGENLQATKSGATLPATTTVPGWVAPTAVGSGVVAVSGFGLLLRLKWHSLMHMRGLFRLLRPH